MSSVVIPYSPQAYQLFHDGTIALAEVEANGIRIDEKYLVKSIRKTKKKIKQLKNRLNETDVMKTWKKTYRSKTNLNSDIQLGKILFEIMEFESPGLTEGGRHKTDAESLASVDHPFIKAYLKIQKLEKASGTYLEGLLREVVDGFVHPFFNLHTTRTYRSSSNAPNFQNIPVRDPEIELLIRTAFISRKKHVLVELDIKGVEVSTAACYHHDPTMLKYLRNPSSDMHRDMAMECYLLSKKEVTKTTRYCAKNKFVFPQFYGDWYITCAKSLWDAINQLKLETVRGIPLMKHLRSKGITELGDLNPKEKPRPGTFERHIQQVEKRFWNERFDVYDQWKKDWYADYQEKGWFITKTGFICQGYMKKNEAINYPIQGDAFHLLLWSLIQLVKKDLKRLKMKTKIVGQIHDSLVCDVPIEELDDFLALAWRVMVVRLLRRFPWIIVPIEIEAEVTPVGGSWADKKEVKINA